MMHTPPVSKVRRVRQTSETVAKGNYPKQKASKNADRRSGDPI